jgi:hypothetical protein
MGFLTKLLQERKGLPSFSPDNLAPVYIQEFFERGTAKFHDTLAIESKDTVNTSVEEPSEVPRPISQPVLDVPSLGNVTRDEHEAISRAHIPEKDNELDWKTAAVLAAKVPLDPQRLASRFDLVHPGSPTL